VRDAALQLRRYLARFRSDERGAFALVVGLASPMLLFAGTAAVEMAETMSARANLQNIVDSAALTGARQLATDRSPATETRTQAQAQTQALVLYPRWTIVTTATMNAQAGRMTVTQAGTRASLFGGLFSPPVVSVTATAEQSSSKPLCVLGIEGGGPEVVQVRNSAALKADGCLVQSNGDLRANNSSQIQAGAARAVGAAIGMISPAPITDVPAIADPFATLPIDVPPVCNDVLGVGVPLLGNLTLNPGVHCGVYLLVGNTTVTLNPGEHYFANGLFVALGNTTIRGSDVVVVFKGLSAVRFGENAVLDLDGRKSGPLAGFVLVSDRSFDGTFDISTSNARNIHGTVYLPNATLDVKGNNNRVADQSPWTVIVAKRLGLSGSANLTVNAGFATSPVPVPDGVGPNVPLRLSH
jgi:Flp pilus assembly protein TadG